MSIQESIWVERYRPHTLDEIVGHPQVVERLQSFAGDAEMPNIMFAGRQGVGKTAMTTALAREIYGEDWKQNMLELNASDDRGIDVVREQIKDFARTDTVGDYDFKLIFLDEVDNTCLPGGTPVITGYPSKMEVKPIEEVARDGEPIPSIDFDTNEIQSDSGHLVEEGQVEYYDIELSDGRSITASPEHPFFIVGKDEKLVRTELKELSEGDEIADFKNELDFTQCPTCGDWTPDTYCSVQCKNEGHSNHMAEEGNPMFGKERSEETKQKISQSKRGQMVGSANPKRPSPDGGRASVETDKIEKITFSHIGKAWNIAMDGTPNFLLANGILTHNTKDAQSAMRRTMEDYSDKTRFILSCNYPNKVLPPIQSRCAVFRISPLQDGDIAEIVQRVADEEELTFEGGAKEMLVDYASGDARKAINDLQAAMLEGKVDEEGVETIAGVTDYQDVMEILNLAISGELSEAQKKLDVDVLKAGVSENYFLETAFNYVKSDMDIPDDARSKILDTIAETDYRILEGANPHIHLHACLAKIMVHRHLSLPNYNRD